MLPKNSTFSGEDIELTKLEKRQLDASDIRGSGLYQVPRRHRGEPETLDARIVADR
jgi:hypothetical protein